MNLTPSPSRCKDNKKDRLPSEELWLSKRQRFKRSLGKSLQNQGQVPGRNVTRSLRPGLVKALNESFELLIRT